jgi:uncharacterized membrane protein (DUF106 family)
MFEMNERFKKLRESEESAWLRQTQKLQCPSTEGARPYESKLFLLLLSFSHVIPIFTWCSFILSCGHFKYLNHFLYLVIEDSLQANWNMFLEGSKLCNAFLTVTMPFTFGVRTTAFQILWIGQDRTYFFYFLVVFFRAREGKCDDGLW